MMTEPPRNLLFRLSDQKGRVTIALLAAVVTYVLTFRLEIGLRIAIAYDFSVATYLVLLAYRINNITAEDLKDFYEDREPSSRLARFGVVLFSSLSMAGVGLMADMSRNWPPIQAKMHTAFCLLAIVLSWILLHAFYALYYGHLYYDVDEGQPQKPLRKGLDFPTDEMPDYWDFLYYSFTIAMCYQTPDVTIVSRTMRRVTLFHAILSFLYVTAILGLVINILSNEI
jgi:uncharacterized membrane protein